tara:strand:+ start:19673 stop:20719 length:1047 start_codon:yes stop_codon:yes gene_type:complete
MKLKICFLKDEHEKLYEKFIIKNTNGLIYHSINYKKFLSKSLDSTIDKYIIALRENKIIASLPCFIKISDNGNVLNSLPFFGSHGSLIGFEQLNKTELDSVFIKFKSLINTYNIQSYTIVDNYKNNNSSILNKYFEFNKVEKRVSQITDLSNFTKNNINDNLLNHFDGKRRTDIKKGNKNNFEYLIDNSLNSLKHLFQIHVENIRALGGISKEWKIFQNLSDIFIKNKQCNIFTVKEKGKIICSLLLIYYKDTVYYFIPAVLNEYKSTSVMSSNIFWAMKDSIRRGYAYWDWGGSWLNQGSLIKFKSSWKSINTEYNYYIKYSKRINNYNKSDILKDYPYFYVKPFND